jgi:uncharacterized membrane-anchored protein
MLVEKAYAQIDIVQSYIPGVVNVSDIFALLTNVVIGVGIALVIIFLVVGGIQYVTARGDVKQAEAARSSLTNAVIGFIIVIAAFTIRLVVTNLLGSNIETIGDTPYTNNVLPL